VTTSSGWCCSSARCCFSTVSTFRISTTISAARCPATPLHFARLPHFALLLALVQTARRAHTSSTRNSTSSPHPRSLAPATRDPKPKSQAAQCPGCSFLNPSPWPICPHPGTDVVIHQTVRHLQRARGLRQALLLPWCALHLYPLPPSPCSLSVACHSCRSSSASATPKSCSSHPYYRPFLPILHSTAFLPPLPALLPPLPPSHPCYQPSYYRPPTTAL
jgi:hypothetical protein